MPEPAAPAGRSKGPALAEVRMHLHGPADPAEGVVVSTERCTRPKSSAFVRHIAFDVGGAGSRLAGAFRSGQAFGVLPPGLDEHGKPHKLRLYSLASPTRGEDGKAHIVATTVKRTIVEDAQTGRLKLGVASNYLSDLQPGDKVRLTGPSGKRFVLPADPGAHDYLFFATGTGIAPFRGMILDLLAAGVSSRIVLVMGSPYATDLLYDDLFTGLAARHTNFRYLTSLSRERQEERGGGGPPTYVHDRLRTHRDELAPMLSAPGERGLVYVCGIAGMELGVLQGLAQALKPDALEPYVRVDPAAGDPGGWQRTMIHKLVTPTRRVFVEVY